MHSRTTPHRRGERVQWHQPRAAATWTPPYLIGRGESAVLDGHPQRRNAKVGQDIPSIGEEENRPSVDGCSKNAPPLRRIAAILARFLARLSLNVSLESPNLKLSFM